MRTKTAIVSAFLAAALYALNAPLSKLLLGSVPPSMMAAFLYLGAGLGMLAMAVMIAATILIVRDEQDSTSVKS